jgi:hypothetical protein
VRTRTRLLLVFCAAVLGIITYAARSAPAQILLGTGTGVLLAATVCRRPLRRCADCGLAGTIRLTRAAYRSGAVPDLVRADDDGLWYCRDPHACAGRAAAVRW